ncbi:MAG TPA: chemotaxis protein CheW [Candidatus Sulfotelmatobacter sp.]|nr:chemotaxis protein CheW [Candidatus Sulfotelmatobacter sp.]
MDEIVKEFLIESSENLDRLDQELVKLEGEPSSKELLASIFRTIHTIKGSCGFLGFAQLERLTHAGENLLSPLRDGQLALNAQITSGLLAMVDAVRHMLAAIQASGEDGKEDYATLVGQLAGLQGEPTAQPAAAASDPAPDVLPALQPAVEEPHAEKKEESSSKPSSSREASRPRRKRKVEKARPDPTKIGGVLVERGQLRPEDLALALEMQEKGRQKIGEILVAHGAASPEDVFAAQKIVESRNPDAAVETIRVGLTLLDRLMNLVGELVLARNQLLQFSSRLQDPGFQAVSQRMNLIATELQEEVMKTRMQPIGNLWNKFPRTVRDLALGCGKQVRLEMEGQDTELDRTIIEAIKDPLTHLIRNSMDHGIEESAARQRAGKDPTGILRLRAFHEGGQVNLEISDDGAGLNGDRIRQKAIERGLITTQQATRMPDRDIFNLIFLPGFSTAEKVTKVSGRGVGMDVVKTNVEKIGGTVDIHSTPGLGTTVRVRIPLTLAIIPALITTCGGERFAIPQVSLLELVRLDSEDKGKAIERVHGAPVYRLRGRLVPLVYLGRELGIRTEAGNAARCSTAINIVVLQAEDRQFGLIVDEITDTEEIVVKPLAKQLKGINAYSGATIMGDGRVALILDVLGLAQKARVIAEARPPASDEARSAAGTPVVSDEHALLLAENGLEGRVAIPLAMVARLEEFPRTVVEHAGTQEVMQYRGQVIPLLRLSEIIPATRDADIQASTGSIQVVIYSEGKRAVGLIVDRIIDIVEEHAAVEAITTRPGVVGSFVSQHHVTDLLDLPAIVRAAIPGLFDATEAWSI